LPTIISLATLVSWWFKPIPLALETSRNVPFSFLVGRNDYNLNTLSTCFNLIHGYIPSFTVALKASSLHKSQNKILHTNSPLPLIQALILIFLEKHNSMENMAVLVLWKYGPAGTSDLNINQYIYAAVVAPWTKHISQISTQSKTMLHNTHSLCINQSVDFEEDDIINGHILVTIQNLECFAHSNAINDGCRKNQVTIWNQRNDMCSIKPWWNWKSYMCWWTDAKLELSV